jgi:hypothetical protein
MLQGGIWISGKGPKFHAVHVRTEKDASMEPPKPDWNPADKEKSLREYASWFNGLARETFLENGNHSDLFFLITEDGEIVGYKFRDDSPIEERNASILRVAQQFEVFGTLYIRITTAYHPKLTGDPRAEGLNFLDGASDANELTRVCLITEMESKNGTHKTWVNPVLEDHGQTSLGDTIIASLV